MNQLSRALSMLFLCVVLIAISCSESNKATNNPPPPNQATASIGPAGGTISFNSEIDLVIPAGALADTVDFTIQEATTIPTHPDSMNFVSAVFTIDPGGTNFTTPCTLSIHYTQALVGTQAEDSLQISMCHAGTWTDLSTDLDTVNNVAQAEITHLSDFSVTFYVRTAASTDMRAMLDASAPAIEYYGKLWSQLHRMLRYLDKRDPLPTDITYIKATGRFTFQVFIGTDPDPDYDVHGFVLGGPLTYSQFCTDSVEGTCLDYIQIPDTTVGPPAAIADGLHQNEVAIITWFADSDVGPGETISAAGTFSLVMLSHDAYRLTIPQENRLYPADTSRFNITSLNNSWNLTYYLQAGSNWSLDGTIWIWPTGITEFVTKIDGDPDSLSALLTYQMNDTLGNFTATYGSEFADASINWLNFLIGD